MEIPSFETWKKRKRERLRQALSATCPHCGADVLDALTENAYNLEGRQLATFDCPGCGELLEFELEWATVLASARPLRRQNGS